MKPRWQVGWILFAVAMVSGECARRRPSAAAAAPYDFGAFRRRTGQCHRGTGPDLLRPALQSHPRLLASVCAPLRDVSCSGGRRQFCFARPRSDRTGSARERCAARRSRRHGQFCFRSWQWQCSHLSPCFGLATGSAPRATGRRTPIAAEPSPLSTACVLFTRLQIGAMPFASLEEIRAQVGKEIGVSSWLSVDQARIDAFAEATEDRQFIHTTQPRRRRRRSAGPSPTASFHCHSCRGWDRTSSWHPKA